MARWDGTGWGGRGWNGWLWQWENDNVDTAAGGGAKVAGDDGWHSAKLAAGTTSSSSDRRDRGWHSGGKPSSRPTSTFMKGQGMNKGESKLTGKGTSPSRPVMWATKGSFKGKSKLSPKGYSGKNSYYQDYYESGMLALETVDENVQLYANEMHAPGSQSSGASLV